MVPLEARVRHDERAPTILYFQVKIPLIGGEEREKSGREIEGDDSTSRAGGWPEGGGDRGEGERRVGGEQSDRMDLFRFSGANNAAGRGSVGLSMRKTSEPITLIFAKNNTLPAFEFRWQNTGAR
ncbi:hypothetical protein KM043_002767 [Ampulex compressa]|nr:hypothetical protein KM043_002767 [Ampulex compressa]